MSIIATDGNDSIALTEILTGESVNLGKGNDSIVITSELIGMKNSEIFGDDGIKNISVTTTAGAGLLASSIKTAAYDDVIKIISESGTALYGNSSIDAGDGKNNISLTGKWGMEEGASVTSGSGNDTITIASTFGTAILGSTVDAGHGANTVNVTSNAWGLHSSTINSGDGNDTISVSSTEKSALIAGSHVLAGNGDNYINAQGKWGLEGNSSIKTGNGHDSITVNASYGTGLLRSIIDAGAGHNSVSVTSATWSVSDASSIITGDGNDTISVVSNTKTALYSSTILAGNGKNKLALEGAWGMEKKASITTGTGNDTLKITATVGSAMYDSTANVGNGDNYIDIQGKWGMEENSHLIAGNGSDSIKLLAGYGDGLIKSTIDAGDGDNEIFVNSAAWGISSNSKIVSGSGDDSIAVTGKVGMACSSILSGAGNDNIAITGSEAALSGGSILDSGSGDDVIYITSNADAMRNTSSLLAGKGNDSVYITGILNGISGNVRIDMGDGNDFLSLTPFEGSTIVRGNVVLDGGENFAVDYNQGQLGDILSFSSGLALQSSLGGINSVNTKGFEALHLELANQERDILNVDNLMNSLVDKNLTSDIGSIIVTGDSKDQLLLEFAEIVQNSTTIAGFDGIEFSHYTSHNKNNEIVHIYIQKGIHTSIENIGNPSTLVDDRIVLFKEGNASFNCLDGNNDANASIVAVSSGKYGEVTYDDGNIHYSLLPRATLMLNQVPSNQVLDEFTYTLKNSNGETYIKTVQVVIIRSPEGSEIYTSDDAVSGEMFYQHANIVGDEDDSTIEITASNGNDRFTALRTIAGAVVDLKDGHNIANIGILEKHSSLLSGKGDDSITIQSITSGSLVHAGNGHNNIVVSGAITGTRITTPEGFRYIDGSSIVTGGGNDTISISPGGYLQFGSLIDAGEGDNTITLYSSKQSANFMLDSSGISIGDGDNDIKIFMGTVREQFTILKNGSYIHAGNGDNKILFQSASSIPGNLMEKSEIVLGDGCNFIKIKEDSNQVATALLSSSILVGNGDNKIDIAVATGLAGSSIGTGDGHNNISFSTVGAALRGNSSITTGDGNDTISIVGQPKKIVAGAGGVDGSTIDTGDGNDLIFIRNQSTPSASATALHSSNIFSGEGEDTIVIDGSISGKALQKSCIDTGSGNDSLTLSHSVSFVDINMGDGDDYLAVYGGSKLAFFGDMAMVQGGDNEALDYSQGQIGDVFAVNFNQTMQLKHFSSNIIQGFETLHVDMLDDKQGTLDIDVLLGRLDSGHAEVGNFQGVVITADANDHIIMSNGALHESGVELNNAAFAGVSFDRYTYESDASVWYDILIQSIA